MEDLFNHNCAQQMRDRICSVSATSERQWGKMSVAQMLEHCARGVEMGTGEARLPRILLGPIVKPLMLKDGTPIRRNSPTAPGLLMTDETDLKASRAHLLDAYDRFVAGGEQHCTTYPHAFFGPLKPNEWSKLMHKHLDHHLRQFGA